MEEASPIRSISHEISVNREDYKKTGIFLGSYKKNIELTPR